MNWKNYFGKAAGVAVGAGVSAASITAVGGLVLGFFTGNPILMLAAIPAGVAVGFGVAATVMTGAVVAAPFIFLAEKLFGKGSSVEPSSGLNIESTRVGQQYPHLNLTQYEMDAIDPRMRLDEPNSSNKTTNVKSIRSGSLPPPYSSL